MTRHKWKDSKTGNGRGKCVRCGMKYATKTRKAKKFPHQLVCYTVFTPKGGVAFEEVGGKRPPCEVSK